MTSTTQLGLCLALFPLGAVVMACSNEDGDTDFTSSPPTTAQVGQDYSYAITTRNNGDTPTITTTDVPLWLTLTDHGDGTALLRGVPSPVDVGMHRVELRLDSGSRSSAQAFDIDVQSELTEVGQDDEFEGEELQDFWRFYDPRGTSTLEVGGGTIRISVPGGMAHDLWRGNDNQAPRLLQRIDDSNFGVEAKFDSVPEQRFQIQGIVAQERDDKLIRLDLHHNGTSLRVYAAYIEGLVARVRVNRSVQGPVPDRLRVLRNGEYWTLQYSSDGEEWRVASAFSQPLVVNEIGVFAGNAHGVDSPPYTAVIDYFRNAGLTSLPEIELPDGPDVERDPNDEAPDPHDEEVPNGPDDSEPDDEAPGDPPPVEPEEDEEVEPPDEG